MNEAFEKGITWNWHYRMIRALISLTKQNVKLFESVEDYIDERLELLSSKESSDVKLMNFKNLFICFFGVLSVLLLAHTLQIFRPSRWLEACPTFA